MRIPIIETFASRVEDRREDQPEHVGVVRRPSERLLLGNGGIAERAIRSPVSAQWRHHRPSTGGCGDLWHCLAGRGDVWETGFPMGPDRIRGDRYRARV